MLGRKEREAGEWGVTKRKAKQKTTFQIFLRNECEKYKEEA